MASLAARLHSLRFQSHRHTRLQAIRGLMPHHAHSCFSCASSGRGPRVPTTLLLETVRLRPWTRGLMLLRERTGLWPRVTTTFLRRTVRLRPWAGDLFCPELRVLRLIPTGVETRIPTGLKYVPISDQGDRDFYTQLTHAVYTNHPAVNSDVWVPVTTKGVKTQVDFSPGGLSSSLHAWLSSLRQNKFSGSAN